MKNYRSDKKLKRKKQWKKYDKIKKILKDWRARQLNRQMVGLPGEKPPVFFTDRKKYEQRISKSV